MKRFLAVLILFFGALALFAEDGDFKRHNVFVGVADFFVYDGMYGLITYGYSLDRNNLLKASFDFKYHESDRYEWKYVDSDPDEFTWSVSVGWQRYLLRQRLRPYVGIGARYSDSHKEIRFERESIHKDTERAASITIPLGIDFSITESIGIGLETEILFSRRFVAWDYQYERDEPFVDDYVEYGVDTGGYKFYIVFRF